MKLSNSDYELIMRDYDSKQYKSNTLLLERKAKLYETVPEIKEIENELASESAALAKKSASLTNEEFKELARLLTEKKERAQTEKQRLMEENGFPTDYLTDIFECPSCKDTGYADGKKCHCFEKKARLLLKNRELLSKLPSNARFSLFREDYYSADDVSEETGKTSRDNALAALSLAKDFVSRFGEEKENMLIFGNTGTGKTFLASCIANEIAEAGHSVSFVTAFQFFGLLEKLAFHKSDTDYSKVEDSVHFLLSSDLLVLDDIGTEIINSFTLTKLYEFINDRILNGKSTLITTNFDPQTINKVYGERILSRLAGNYSFIKLTGSDIRLMKGSKDLD